MTNDDANAAEPTFEALMAEVMMTAPRFGHRQHIQLTWLAATRFYRPATLAAQRAKGGWVEPDLAPFPWQRLASRDPRADQWRWRPSSRNRFCRPGMQSAARLVPYGLGRVERTGNDYSA